MQRQNENNMYILSNFILDNFDEAENIIANYPNLIIQRIAPNIYTVEVPPEAEQELIRLNAEVNFLTSPIIYGLNAMPALSASNILQFHEYPYGELRGDGIIIGFVDTGIDYMNDLFKNANNTTRIISIWDQTIEGNPPKGYQYGTVYTQEDINEALQSSEPRTIVPSMDENGHGTFLAGVAAGNDQTQQTDYVGGAPDAGIAMVKLRPATDRVRANFLVSSDVPAYQSNDIIAGINYLVGLSFEIRRPLVICIGLGTNYGAHNGTEILESYLNTISTAANIITVTAIGNEGGSAHHYRGELTEVGQSESIEVNVGEGESGFTLYGWVDVPNKMSVSVKSPLGQVIERATILRNQPQVFRFNLERTILTILYMYPDPLTGGERIIVQLKDPTPGIWTLTAYGDVIISGIYHFWLPRRGFIQNDTRFLRPSPETTVQMPGTDLYSIVVGSYDYLDDSVYVASGRGPTTNDVIKPDIIAPGVNVQGPMPGGGFTTYVGTSTAAAITASAAALLMQWAVLRGNLPGMNTRIARSLFMRGARRRPGTVYPNPIEGYGRLDLQATIANV